MNILYTASEMSPIAKTGGLGDVMEALPAAMREAGHGVSIALPLYRQVREKLGNLERTEIRLSVPLGQEVQEAAVWTGSSRGGVRIFAIENDYFFDRPALYGEEGEYGDNGARFLFFSRAVVELAAWLDPLPEIIHANDWQTGVIPGLVRSMGLPYRTVFTIHNLAYQGIFPKSAFYLTGMPGGYYSPAGYEHFGQFNIMKGALCLSDEISTVSPGYAREIQTGEFGCGFDGLLRVRRNKLTGIVNGIDTTLWNPETDAYLDVNYNRSHLYLKDAAKVSLQRECGWDSNVEAPLFGCISRLADQKGLDVVAAALPDLVRRGARFILLGSGDAGLENAFKAMAGKYPDQVYVQIGFNEGLSHRIEAGVDFFLMPSRFEPCGLNQMYSQRYGTIPIVHGVGGLGDTVVPWELGNRGLLRGWGTGFVFHGLQVDHLLSAVDDALRTRKHPVQWDQIRKNAMEKDFSWRSVIPQYEVLYRNCTAKPWLEWPER